jgi:putative hydrolase of the HAD superfamily
MTPYPYRAVLFDFFGTLTRAVTRGRAHQNIARWLGCDPRAFTAELNHTFLDRARGHYGPPARALRRVTDAVGARPSRSQLALAQPLRVEAVRADTQLREDAVPVLGRLRARGLRTGLISDCGPELPEYLPTLPVAPLLDTCVYSIEAGVCKPDPEIYRIACRRLAVEPAECLYIGDGGSQELSGASRVGMTAIRLAAPDLGGHLKFNGEQNWAGRSARTLTEAVRFLLE